MNLLRAASMVSLFTLASRITGLVRELLIASAFGASATTDVSHPQFAAAAVRRRGVFPGLRAASV
jgi:putative peptidoglycan lipid II flippase